MTLVVTMSESLPAWAKTKEDKFLLGVAIRLGATPLELSDKSICEGLVTQQAGKIANDF